MELLEKGLKNVKATNGKALMYIQLCKMLYWEKRYGDYISYYHKAKQYFGKEISTDMAAYMTAIKEIIEGNADKAEKTAMGINNPDDRYAVLREVYVATGDYRKAYSSLLKGNELRDTLWQQEKAESLQELTVKYETKETELALAQSEARRASTLMWLFAALGLLLVAAILFVAYAGRQRRRRLQNEMEFARLRADVSRQYVEGLENERRRMASELHDGVCNDLLAIKMSIGGGQSPADAAALIETCRESVRRISHELMPPEFAYATLDEVIRFFVNGQAEAAKPKTAITYASSITGSRWEDIPDTVSLEIYRIVQEAVGNAVKHSGATTIAVQLTVAEGRLTLSVTDNGTFHQGSKRGVGLDSIRRRAAAIGGKVTITHPDTGGTVVTLEN